MKNRLTCGLGVLFLVSAVLTLTLTAVVVSAAGKEIQQIKPEEVKKLIESKKTDFVIVDTQPKGVYDTGHIKGAINFPWAPELKSPGKLPKNKMLLLYCDCAHEEDSIDTATQLMEKWGYTNLKVIEGGWSKWQELGYPVDKKK
jgi:3-mercaptopyruvate sulfurtransferase SseA